VAVNPPSTPTELTVRLARRDELDDLAVVLADAFHDDPVMRFIVPGGDRYPDRLRRLFRIELTAMLRRDATWVVDDGDLLGVAVWAPPDQWKQRPIETIRGVVPALRVFGFTVRTAVGVLNALEEAHPDQPPHWYLGSIGTAAAHQGRGVGSRLLHAVLDRCDTEGVPAYLESSKPENVPYYERFGFETRGELILPGGPVVHPMWREPRPAT
jgi:GNAT superfamily N-acetyltransferase